jgi:hypothetical protein
LIIAPFASVEVIYLFSILVCCSSKLPFFHSLHLVLSYLFSGLKAGQLRCLFILYSIFFLHDCPTAAIIFSLVRQRPITDLRDAGGDDYVGQSAFSESKFSNFCDAVDYGDFVSLFSLVCGRADGSAVSWLDQKVIRLFLLKLCLSSFFSVQFQ